MNVGGNDMKSVRTLLAVAVVAFFVMAVGRQASAQVSCQQVGNQTFGALVTPLGSDLKVDLFGVLDPSFLNQPGWISDTEVISKIVSEPPPVEIAGSAVSKTPGARVRQTNEVFCQ